MIKFSNGHEMDFACASGALAFRGEGWWFEQPARWLNLIRPKEITIITKTLTLLPRKGNLRWWCPWRCVHPHKNSVVNAVGLTNPGLPWWINKCYGYMIAKGYKTIVSVMPETIGEAIEIASQLNCLDSLVAVELNLSCPNVTHDEQLAFLVALVKKFVKCCCHPVMVKLGIQLPYVELCKELDGVVEAFDLINAVPWHIMHPKEKSPLERYGLVGAVSGKDIRPIAREALLKVTEVGVKTPICSGGANDSYEEVSWRFGHGALACTFGVIFMTKPWLPNLVANQWRASHA